MTATELPQPVSACTLAAGETTFRSLRDPSAATCTAAPAHETRGYAIAFASALVLSTTAILVRQLTAGEHMPALVLAFWRDLLVAAALLPALALRRSASLRVGWRTSVYLAAFALVLAAFNALWTVSVAINGAAVATVLVYTSAAFTAVLGRWLLAEPFGRATLLAVVLGVGGCVLVAGAYDSAVWRTNPLGIATGVLSGLGYAAYTLLGRSAGRRGLDPWTTLLYTFGLAAGILLVANLVPGASALGAARTPAELLCLGTAWRAWGLLVLLAAGPTLVGFGLYNLSLTRLPSAVVNLIATLEPVFTAILAWTLFGERLTAIQLGGGLAILAGVVLLRVSPERRPAPMLRRALD